MGVSRLTICWPLTFALWSLHGCGARTELDAPTSTTKPGSGAPLCGDAGAPSGITLSVGHGDTCALLPTGDVDCWGFSFDAPPNTCNGNAPCFTTPVAVSGLHGVNALSAGTSVVCALLSDRTVACWGSNFEGELGVGNITGPETCGGVACSTTPTTVSGLSGVAAVAAGTEFVCALRCDGTVMCWGVNIVGELGVGATTGPNPCHAGGATIDACSPVPLAVQGLVGATAITAGADHTCALLEDGTVVCWGANYAGQIGAGTNSGPDACLLGSCAAKPVAVRGLSGVTVIAAGDDHTCALLADGTVECWGGNGFGQLGDGMSYGPEVCAEDVCSTTPIAVAGLSGVTAIAAGGEYTCALLRGGTVSCWGFNGMGDLGVGTSTGPESCKYGGCSTTPVAVPGLSGVTSIAAGGNSNAWATGPGGGTMCAVVAGNTVECWGQNDLGQLGIATNTGPEQCVGVHIEPIVSGPCSTVPVLVPGL